MPSFKSPSQPAASASATNSPVCPLCGSSETGILEELSSSDLSRLYRDRLGIDIGEDLRGTPHVEYAHCESCDFRFFHPPRPGGAGFYGSLLAFDWYYLSDKYEFSYAKRCIRPGDKVLEVGCGAGLFGLSLEGARYTGLETSPKAADIACASGLACFRETVEQHSLQNAGAYDTVCAFQVLEHSPTPRDFLTACVDCLRPGGRLIVSVPSQDSFLGLADNVALHLPPHHLGHYTDACLERLGDMHGFQLTELEHEPLQSYHIGYFSRIMAVLAQKRLEKVRPGRLLDLSEARRLLEERAEPLAEALTGVFQVHFLQPRGQAVVAVYVKDEDTA